ncbi:TauD/TfdA family dioxygenase [Pleionea litopenaei]|uniref:TauD/TfdA family dioxygenase n=1 Tax=Pleionea litopenaei TaxID=3070815 RepID=A0AA51RTR8_9GAMM|nr:TauD/TfdA family dioxygenase [Pleionea sp. HL-JVS1]WMS87334.1 TauD/TfdA family dioxygenase [Pleionea sp. HL-JVS1]
MTNLKISIDDLEPIGGLPLLFNVDTEGKRTMDWLSENKSQIQDLISKNGALLLRGLKIISSKQFGDALETIFDGKLIEYKYRSTPRTGLRGNVYTATEYPSNEVIAQHNENAYSRSWPNRIGLFCMLPAQEGGETPISDSRLIYERLPEEVRLKFEEKGIMYVRNYSDMDLPWTEVFQTEDRAEVEQYCVDNELQFEWKDNNALRTVQVNPAVAFHPVTNEKIWFNQAHLFHISNIAPEMRDVLIDSLGEENLPRNTFYGDGEPIEEDVLNMIRDLYEKTKIKFQWQKNDLLLLDNMLFTHGRESFVGERRVLAGMACPNR